MKIIEVTDDLSFGIEEIDLQHRRLVEIVNELFNAMSEGKGRRVLKSILEELVDYAEYHFNTEENLMLQYEFLGFEEHKIKHNDFREKIRNLKIGYEDGSLSISTELLRFLVDWIKDHLLTMDKKYAPFLIEKGVK